MDHVPDDVVPGNFELRVPIRPCWAFAYRQEGAQLGYNP